MNAAPLLSVSGLHAHYGKSHILRGVSFDVGRAEIVSLLGRNGSGRSTTMKAIMGLVTPSAGSVKLGGQEVSVLRPFKIARAGLAYVPEEREVFANLTVDENLRMGMQTPVPGAPRWTLDEVFDYFPRLRERRGTRAGSLSGGEQQMLTMGRSLLGNPLMMLIDEPTEGLAPKIVRRGGRIHPGHSPARCVGRARGAEACDCAEGVVPRLHHGTWTYRVRRHAGAIAGGPGLLDTWLAV